MKGTEELLHEINRLLDRIGKGSPARQEPPEDEGGLFDDLPEADTPLDEPPPEWVSAAGDVAVVERPAPQAPEALSDAADDPAGDLEADAPLRPRRAQRTEERRSRPRRVLARELRFLGILLLAFIVGAGVGGVVILSRPGTPTRGAGEATSALPGGEQTVIAWTVWQEDPPAMPHVAVIGAGGGLDPVVVGVPSATIASIPGYGLGTVGDAARAGDAALAATTVESLMQVHMDHALPTTMQQLSVMADALGGVRVGEQTMDGATVTAYLTGGENQSEELRFLRWQEFLRGFLPAAAARPAALKGAIPKELRPAFAAAGGPEAALLELPVEDAGAGLAKPLREKIGDLIAKRFVATSVIGRQVRLVILNGNGAPGVGEQVAALLVPAGFRLVSSQNADSFDKRKTRIVASREDLLDEARLAQELLGVGEVNFGPQPTGLADVTVIVGLDFRGA